MNLSHYTLKSFVFLKFNFAFLISQFWIHLFVCLRLNVSVKVILRRYFKNFTRSQVFFITINLVLSNVSLSLQKIPFQQGYYSHAEGNFESRYRKFSLRFLFKSFKIQFSCFVSCINLFFTLLFTFERIWKKKVYEKGKKNSDIKKA